VRTAMLALMSVFACHGVAIAATHPKAILVTRASTGIGRNIVEHLSAEGYFIYATARKDTDLAALAKLKNVQPIPT
jgi:NADP-dependent 3-hydroxy acid dehydrogenase YdfG